MGFLAPWFLAGALALGVPVFVHLLRRQTTVPRPFSSLMFFERGMQSSTRHRRLRYLLLFALRVALVVLLVLAFANPFMRRSECGGERAAAADGGGQFVQPMRRCGDAVCGCEAGGVEGAGGEARWQKAQVMALGAELQVLTQPVEDAGTLRAAVEGIQQGDSKGNFGELGRGMRALAETVHTPVELHLFSDMQKTEMPGELCRHGVAGECEAGAAFGWRRLPLWPNWTVESVRCSGAAGGPEGQEAVAGGGGDCGVWNAGGDEDGFADGQRKDGSQRRRWMFRRTGGRRWSSSRWMFLMGSADARCG